MCPACVTNAALAVAGATSAGGLTALVVGVIRSRLRLRRLKPTTPKKENG